MLCSVTIGNKGFRNNLIYTIHARKVLGKENIVSEISCFECKNFQLCFLRRKMEDLARSSNMINIDGTKKPGKYVDLFKTLASMCLEYK